MPCASAVRGPRVDARPRDTVAILTGPATLFWKRPPDLLPLYTQPLFSGRPVWATGEGWIALGHGDSTRMLLRDLAGELRAVVRWPERRDPVSDEDRLDAARWRIAMRVLHHSYTREHFAKDTPEERRKGVEWEAFDDRFVYVTYRDGNGVPLVERYRLPQIDCD